MESSLVEPESKDSSKSSSNQDKEEALEEGESADDVVLFQPPSSAVEITESKVSRSVDESSGATMESSEENRTKERPSTSFDDDKIEDLGVDARAGDTLDRKKKYAKKLHMRKAKSKEDDPQEQSWFSGWGLSTITDAVQQTVKPLDSVHFWHFDRPPFTLVVDSWLYCLLLCLPF